MSAASKHCGRDEPGECDLHLARSFLELIGADSLSETVVFQTFDEVELADGTKRRDQRLTRTLLGPFDRIAAELVELNARGAGIFVTVNHTDITGRRKAENIIGIRAIWHEDDSGSPISFALEPSLTVETSPGKFHRWWLCKGISPEDHQGVMQTMVDQYGSDHRARDLARVLRVPGFYHRKRMPFLVRILGLHASGFPALSYTRDQILRAFPPTSRTSVAAPLAAPSDSNYAELFRALGYIDAEDREVDQGGGPTDLNCVEFGQPSSLHCVRAVVACAIPHAGAAAMAQSGPGSFGPVAHRGLLWGRRSYRC